ncbi:mitochondrial FAD carrier protein [Schizophyllum fasciatum]
MSASANKPPLPPQPPSFFPSPALDHAAAGIGAGVVNTLCMNPLDLLKVKFQVATAAARGGLGTHIWHALRDIQRAHGWRGLYRGLGPNVAGNASSWGLYFWFYNILKHRASGGDLTRPLPASDYLLCSAQASAATAIITNPLWVVKVRMFTTPPDAPGAYRGLWHGLTTVARTEGWRGLTRGTALALVGVSNGAIQFTLYEEMKAWAFARRRRRVEREGGVWDAGEKLSNTAYTLMSGSSKLGALISTYPYQVVRSRMQNDPTGTTYPSIPATLRRTWAQEGLAGFYRGLGTNIVRVLPGTCVTFVVYENLAWLLRRAAARRGA